MQKLLKFPNYDFSTAVIDVDDDYIFNKDKKEIKKNQNDIKSILQSRQIIQKQKQIQTPKRPSSCRSYKNNEAFTCNQKQKYLHKKNQNGVNQKTVASNIPSPQLKTAYPNLSEKIPVITSTIKQQKKSITQTQNGSYKNKIQYPEQHQDFHFKGQVSPQTQANINDQIKGLNILDWSKEIDNEYIIKDAQKLLNSNSNKELMEIGKQNREKLVTSYRQQNQKQKDKVKFQETAQQDATSKSKIIDNQTLEIQQTTNNINQLRLNDILNNNLVICKIPKNDEYENDFEENEFDTENNPNNQKDSNYENEEFEKEEDLDNQKGKSDTIPNKNLEQQQQQNTKKSEYLDHNISINQEQEKKVKKEKKYIYRARTPGERKQELLAIKVNLEKHLIENNQEVKIIYQKWQDQVDKEKIMLEVSQNRKNQLNQANIQLQQLQEKIEIEKRLIDDLEKKQHYAEQIIEKLKDNKEKFKQDYEWEIKKYLACKIIARFFIGRKDRKLYQEYRNKRFLEKLQQQQ